MSGERSGKGPSSMFRDAPVHSTPYKHTLTTPLIGRNYSTAHNEGELHSALRQRLGHLRDENSQLVTQSHRLISELEDSSHHLLSANSKVGELQEELAREKAEPARERVATLEAQVKTMQGKLAKNTDTQVRLEQLSDQQHREKDQWALRQRALQEQLGDVQEECRRLQEACSLAEERASEKELSSRSLPHFSKSFSSQSLSSYPSLHRTRYPTNPPDHTRNHTHHHHKPHPSLLKATADASPLANSTLLGHSPTGSTSSLSSIKSTQSAKEFPISYPRSQPLLGVGNYGSWHTSTPRTSYLSNNPHSLKLKSGRATGRVDVGRGTASSVELDRANSRIRHLEKEVSLLEQHLADKTRSGQSHVEELTQLRTELARERAARAMAAQESREQAAGELGRLRTLHSEQCRELQAQLERLQGERAEAEREAGQLRTSLKASHSEAANLSQRVSALLQQLEQERASHTEAMRVLHEEAESGGARVSQLEHVLEACRQELTGHVTHVEETAQLHKSEVEQLKNKAATALSELGVARQQLVEKVGFVGRLEAGLAELRVELQRGKGAWQEREAELKHALQQSEVIRQSLLQQVERSTRELAGYSSRLAEHQQTAAELRQCQGELSRLRLRAGELQGCREELERAREEWREERVRLVGEAGQLQAKLETAKKQMEEARDSCREGQRAREEGSRECERLCGELQRRSGELETYRAELAAAEARAAQREEEVEGSLTHMQQELTKRAQQVLEMDGLLRSHQADTTARRLQLERALSQRQAELRARTQELEELSVRHSEDGKSIEVLSQQVARLQSTAETTSSEKQKQLTAKGSELLVLQQKLKEVESVSEKRGRESGKLRADLEASRGRARELEARCQALERKEEELQRERDGLQEKHVGQLQRLQESHTAMLASREQQAGSHRLQLQQLAGQERVRQEELSRCRAQVASLSAELAAERQVAEEGRRHVALARAETARHQAQVSSLQRALSLNNMASMTRHRTGGVVPPMKTDPAPSHPSPPSISPPPHVTPQYSTPLPVPVLQNSVAKETPIHISMATTNGNPVAIDTTLTSDADTEVEFALLPLKLSTPLVHPPMGSQPLGRSTGQRGKIINI